MPRTPLLHPDEFFEERASNLDLITALGVAVLLALVTTAATGIFGLAFAEALDVSVPVDNPAHRPNWVCEQNAEAFPDQATVEGCGEDVPETIQRDLGSLVWDEFSGLLPIVFFGALVTGLLTAVGLHVLTALDGGDGSFDDTLAVTAWGATPLVVQMVLSVGYLVYRLQRLTLPKQPEAAVEKLATLVTFESRLPLLVLSLVVTGWQVTIWAYGLKHTRNVSLASGAAASGLVGAGLFLFSLLG